ncbi:hypothetical protein KC950_01645 [Candidatus Saccharibacteria bacterium]|nr:hypothetical protein [Candidatus Saccharibacteria bacterium]
MLSKLLGATEPLFSLSIQQLEEVSGMPSEDVRLTAEILGKVRMKIEELGLDPDDTSPKELHMALMSKIEEHDKHLVKQIGGKDPNDPDELMPLMKKAWQKVETPKTAWVIKKTVAKEMLKKKPPKQIMAHLGYRSVDSMLKRENMAEIYGALRFAESPEWLNEFNEEYKRLKPADFQNRQIEVIEMPLERWGDIAAPFIHKKRHNITHLKELGVILMLPVTKEANLKGIAIFTLPLLFHYLQEIRLYSSFFKLQQVKSDFGKIIVETLIADTEKHAVMAGQNIHWRVIQRYFGKLENEKHPEIFQPHVQPEDLHWRKAEDLLFEVAPELIFWKDLDFVGIMDKDKRPVTLNMLDVAASFVNQTPYPKRAIYHFREALWNEIFIRYMGQDVLEKQILQQLDNDMIMPEKL